MNCLPQHKTVGADLRGEGEETAAIELIFRRGHWPVGEGKDGHIWSRLTSLHLPGKERILCQSSPGVFFSSFPLFFPYLAAVIANYFKGKVIVISLGLEEMLVRETGQ